MRDWGLTPTAWRALDEGDRDLLLAESEMVCPSCGNLRSVCSAPDAQWYPQRTECYATAARELAVRRLRKKHPGEPGPDAVHTLDGLSLWVSEHDLSPEDDFL